MKMGSGYITNEYAMRALRNLTGPEKKKALESLGVNFLIDIFSRDSPDDFTTRSRAGAELVKKSVVKDFQKSFGKNYPFSVDIIKKGKFFKISFFK